MFSVDTENNKVLLLASFILSLFYLFSPSKTFEIFLYLGLGFWTIFFTTVERLWRGTEAEAGAGVIVHGVIAGVPPGHVEESVTTTNLAGLTGIAGLLFPPGCSFVTSLWTLGIFFFFFDIRH